MHREHPLTSTIHRARRFTAGSSRRNQPRSALPLRAMLAVAAFLPALFGIAPAALAAEMTPPPPADVGIGAGPAADGPSLDETPGSPAAPGATPGDMSGFEELDLANLLENLVVSATKTEVKEDEAPAITTVVTIEEIRRWGYQSVAEVLRHVAGFYVIDDHILPNVGLRGVSGGLRSESGLIKVMIDGNSTAFRSTAGNWLGQELIPISAIQQIEIIRGPASALYGADAFLGIINIVTRRPDRGQGVDLAVTGNHASATTGLGPDASVSAVNGRWQFLGSFAMSNEDRSGLVLPASSPTPQLPASASSDGVTHDLTLASRVGLFNLSYKLSERVSATATGYYSAIDRGAEFADWAQLTHNVDAQGRANGTMISLQQGFGNLGILAQPSANLDLRFNAMYFTGGPTSHDRIEVASDVFYVKRDFGFRGGELNAETTWRPRKSFTALAGAGVVADQETLPVIYHVAKAAFGDRPAGDTRLESGTVGTTNLINSGVHALAVWTPVQRLNLTAGARYDYHNIYGGKPSARIGGVVTLSKTLHFKLLYGNAFKSPSPQLLYGAPIVVGDISGNAQLRASYVHTAEAQLVYRPVPYLVLTTGGAASYILEQAAFAQVGVNQVAENISQVQSLSWESELRFDYRGKAAAYGNFSLNRTKRQLDDRGYVATLTNYENVAYPTAVAHLGLSAQLGRLPLRLGGEGTYASSRPSSQTNTLGLGREYRLGSYVMADASIRTVGIELLPQKPTVLSVVVRNVLDTRVVDPGFSGVDYPLLGRRVLVQLSQRF
jgi:outer membrane receptor for ferrienterochelin and colicins